MEVEAGIRTRRTHKRFGADPVPREVLAELLELARWAPNHHLTEPWRFRVLGPESLARHAAAVQGDVTVNGNAPRGYTYVLKLRVRAANERQARERLGVGLRAVQADHIAESDEISLRNQRPRQRTS